MNGAALGVRTPDVKNLLELSARVGNDPLLTQGSTGNVSIKMGGQLWIKASGKWMADAAHENILVPLNLAQVRGCVEQNIDPAGEYPGASIETAMHAVLPHRVVLHVHCINTIAWAVLRDARRRLEDRLHGLRWRFIPYVASGLALAQELEDAVRLEEAVVFVLGNHGLVIGGPDANTVDHLLAEVRRRLAVHARETRPADHDSLKRIADCLSWEAPSDNVLHGLGTDAISRTILSGGILYPCQAIFSNSSAPAELYRPVHFQALEQCRATGLANRPFLILEDYGVLLNRNVSAATRAMMFGLAQVVQRIDGASPVRYLTEDETPNPFGVVARRYRELSSHSDAMM